jgi:hypothetical protein
LIIFYPVPRGENSLELRFMGCLNENPGDNLVPFGNNVLDAVSQVGESLIKRA